MKVFHCNSGCGFVATFEEAISKERYELYLKAWGGHRIEDYGIAEDPDKDRVRERLEALGYV
jgi:hypothetical protein